MCWSVLGKRDVTRDKAVEVSRGQTMINLLGHVTQFVLYPNSYSKALNIFFGIKKFLNKSMNYMIMHFRIGKH